LAEQWFCWIDATTCWPAADAGTQLTVFDSSALKKQLPIFLKKAQCFEPRERSGQPVRFFSTPKRSLEKTAPEKAGASQPKRVISSQDCLKVITMEKRQ
jgi:hypothetical protein